MDDLKNLSHDELIARITRLEKSLSAQTELLKKSGLEFGAEDARPAKKRRQFNSDRYSTHLIALKFAYLGGRYQGYEYHANNDDPNAVSAIEEELWRALMKARLIFPTESAESAALPDQEHWEGPINWTGLEYAKCGRTDRGVSAFGQVVSLRVRSNRPLPSHETVESSTEEAVNGGNGAQDRQETNAAQTEALEPFDPVADEINYAAVLNGILPADIRVLGWCPAPSPTFSARFSCRERRYRYFFTRPCFLSTPDASTASARLDIDAMRDAAQYLVGSHDFRNFCKVDGSKQISNFTRRITHASINEVSSMDMPTLDQARCDDAPHCKMFVFELHGSAFLWHQVRCIVAILFLVGQRLEKPSLIKDLLDVSDNGPGLRGKPRYEMADDKPLVLWDCIFPVDENGEVPPVGWQPTNEHGEVVPMKDSLQWITPDRQKHGMEATWGSKGTMNSIWSQWHGRKMDEILAASLFDHAARFFNASSSLEMPAGTTRYYTGQDESKSTRQYVPVLDRPRLQTPDVQNARYAAKKGWKSDKSNMAES